MTNIEKIKKLLNTDEKSKLSDALADLESELERYKTQNKKLRESNHTFKYSIIAVLLIIIITMTFALAWHTENDIIGIFACVLFLCLWLVVEKIFKIRAATAIFSKAINLIKNIK